MSKIFDSLSRLGQSPQSSRTLCFYATIRGERAAVGDYLQRGSEDSARPPISSCLLTFIDMFSSALRQAARSGLSAHVARRSVVPSALPRQTFVRTLISKFNCSLLKTLLIPSFAAKKYTEDHEAVVFDDSTSVGTISITDYAQSSLGDAWRVIRLVVLKAYLLPPHSCRQALSGCAERCM